MTTQKQNWLDLHDQEESDEEVSQIKRQPQDTLVSKQAPGSKQQFPPKDETKLRDRREERQKLRSEQLKLFEELDKQEVWIFIFKNNNPDLQEAVNSLKFSKLVKGEKGWDLRMEREDARRVLTEGFRPKRVFAKIVVGKKNYPREGDWDNRERREDRGDRGHRGDRDQNGGQRHKYVEKGQSAVTNEYTFQKNRKNKKEKDEEEGAEKEKEKERERKPLNRYKNDPLYQGLGDFRNKKASTEQPEPDLQKEKEKPEQKRAEKPQQKKTEKPQYRERPSQKKTVVPARNKYKEKEPIEEKRGKSQEEPEVLTTATEQQKPRKKDKKDVKPKKTSNNPFDCLD